MAEATRPSIMFAIHAPPLALRREAVAALLSISPSEFDLWVKRKIMPRPKKVGKMSLWDRKSVEAAFARLMDEQPSDQDAWDHLAL